VVRTADVPRRLRGDGGCLQPETGLAHRGGSIPNDIVCRGAAVFERQVVVEELQFETEDPGIENPQCFVEQLLPCLVTVADDDLVAR
jgi:hypothetical protein